MPIYYRWDMPTDEIEREYYSTIAFRPMVNAYSGFGPQAWQRFIDYEAVHFPDASSVEKIRSLGVDYLIVEKGRYDSDFSQGYAPVNGDRVVSVLGKNPTLRLVKNLDNFYIFMVVAQRKTK
jgi:hypothetical protein